MKAVLSSALALGLMTSFAMAETSTSPTKMSDADLHGVTAAGYFDSSASAEASALAHGWITIAGAYTGTYTAPGVASAYSSSYASSSGGHKGGLSRKGVDRKAIGHKDLGKGKGSGRVVMAK